MKKSLHSWESTLLNQHVRSFTKFKPFDLEYNLSSQHTQTPTLILSSEANTKMFHPNYLEKYSTHMKLVITCHRNCVGTPQPIYDYTHNKTQYSKITNHPIHII